MFLRDGIWSLPSFLLDEIQSSPFLTFMLLGRSPACVMFLDTFHSFIVWFWGVIQFLLSSCLLITFFLIVLSSVLSLLGGDVCSWHSAQLFGALGWWGLILLVWTIWPVFSNFMYQLGSTERDQKCGVLQFWQFFVAGAGWWCNSLVCLRWTASILKTLLTQQSITFLANVFVPVLFSVSPVFEDSFLRPNELTVVLHLLLSKRFMVLPQSDSAKHRIVHQSSVIQVKLTGLDSNN